MKKSDIVKNIYDSSIFKTDIECNFRNMNASVAAMVNYSIQE
jgi:hypothetical protein